MRVRCALPRRVKSLVVRTHRLRTPLGGRGANVLATDEYLGNTKVREEGKDMASGKVDIRTNQKTGKARMRFYGVCADQLEIILPALDHARSELGTAHDTVALEGICLGYLSSVSSHKKSSS